MTDPLSEADPIPHAAREEIERLLRSGDLFRYTSQGSAVSRLEVEFAAHLGSRFAIAVASCSQALFLALRALDLAPGARVLVPAFTFAAVPSAVVHAGCAPVLVEVGETLRLDMDDLRAKLPGSGAILVSHMRGHTSDMDAILAAAEAEGVPVIEDAAHSLGTLWRGRPIGTLGAMGCFSFQSYKLVNAGEGGMIVTDDADLAARTVIMSGAYEANWRHHAGLAEACARWQERLPLYNMRLSNLSAAVIRPQIPLIPERVERGRRNHDIVAEQLARSPWLSVPEPLPPERRAPDSIQFLLHAMDDAQAGDFAAAASARGVPVQIFGLSPGNARAFWTWRFLGEPPSLPRTRAMLKRAADVRLPPRLPPERCEAIGAALVDAARASMAPLAAE